MNFKQMREKAKLTQQAVADALGVDRSTVSKWESGASVPKTSKLYKIAILYGCKVDDLMKGE